MNKKQQLEILKQAENQMLIKGMIKKAYVCNPNQTKGERIPELFVSYFITELGIKLNTTLETRFNLFNKSPTTKQVDKVNKEVHIFTSSTN